MKTNHSIHTQRVAMFIVAVVIASCDTFSDDHIRPEDQLTFGEKVFYTLPGSPVIIDVASLIEEAFVNATLTISTVPSKGELSQVDNILLKYQPDSGFLTDSDEFAVTIELGGKPRHTETITIVMKSTVEDLPCGLYAINDNAQAVAGHPVVISVLENDRLCGSDLSALEVSIHKLPDHGEASVTGNLITYKSGPTFTEADELIYKINSGADMRSYATLKIRRCALVAASDTINMTNGERSVKILSNDVVCGTRKNGLAVSISSAPQFGTAALVGDSVIVYNAGAEFRGRDQLTYQLTTGAEGDVVHATVLIVADWTVETFDAPVGYVHFIDEMTGFVYLDRLFKTTNGGERWTEQFPSIPTGAYISHLQFLDQQLGYATFITCEHQNSEGNCDKWVGGLLKTTDGGELWDHVSSFNGSAISVFFTSPTTGYVSVDLDAHREMPHNIQIYKTNDSGEHWEDVFSRTTPELHHPLSPSPFELVFASSDIGYAYGSGKIYFTENAGESWQDVTPDHPVTDIAASSNFVFSSTTGYALPDPSTIEKSTHGGNWLPVMNFPYNSFRLGFSPSGKLGVTVGLSNPDISLADPTTWSITITRTLDQGETWTMETVKPLGLPWWNISVPSERVVYFTCDGASGRELIRYSAP